MSEPGRTFADLRTRVLTAIVLLSGFVGLNLWAAYECRSLWFFIPLALLIVACCSLEIARAIISPSGTEALKLSNPRVIVFAVAFFLPAAWTGSQIAPNQICFSVTLVGAFLPDLAFAAILSFIALILFLIIRGRTDLERSRLLAADLFLAFPLVAIGGALLIGLLTLPNASQALLWLVLVTASNDTAAYFAGKRLGGPKLAPAISPNKTISGSTVGILVALLVGASAGALVSTSAWSFSAIILSFIVALVAQVADLMKSLLKRTHSIKDFSQILPGHGGVLDRVDAILGGGAALYVCLLIRQYQGW